MWFIIATSILGAVLGINLNVWQIGWLGISGGIIYLLALGRSWRAALKLENGWAENIIGLLTALTALTLAGVLLFYQNFFSRDILATLLTLLPWVALKQADNIAIKLSDWRQNIKMIAWPDGVILVLAALVIASLGLSQTDEAIRTPWQIVKPITFLAYGFLIGFYLWQRERARLWWTIIVYATALSVLAIVYKLGFGFDPFIHQATAKILDQTGTISPKPLYYVGQYVLTVWGARLLQLSIETIDRWLVPLMSALLIPASLSLLIKKYRWEKGLSAVVLLAPLAFGLPLFTYTTPQALALLLAVATAFWLISFCHDYKRTVIPPWLFSLTALSIHPLSGLPLIFITAWWQIKYRLPRPTPMSRWLKSGLIAGIALVVPLAFLLLNWFNQPTIKIKFNSEFYLTAKSLGQDIFASLPALLMFREPLDAVYLTGRPLTLLFIAIAIGGWLYTRRQKINYDFWLITSGLLTLSYLIMKLGFYFVSLPANEQDFYSVRLWQMALIFLLPVAVVGVYHLLKIITAETGGQFVLIIGGALIWLAAFYLQYPRLDWYHRSTGYNTTRFDVEAVELIEREAGKQPYVVLANQAVAAAALKQYGFAHYYNNYFYYPLPTGTNPLYQVYLTAAEHGWPTRATIKPAASLSGVKQVFLVLNKYWAEFDKLTAVADREADDSRNAGGDRIKIYRYDFSN